MKDKKYLEHEDKQGKGLFLTIQLLSKFVFVLQRQNQKKKIFTINHSSINNWPSIWKMLKIFSLASSTMFIRLLQTGLQNICCLLFFKFNVSIFVTFPNGQMSKFSGDTVSTSVFDFSSIELNLSRTCSWANGEDRCLKTYYVFLKYSKFLFFNS